MKQYKYTTLADIVKRFAQKKIMVIGDLLLDQLIYGEVSRISPEAPVPVVWVNGKDDEDRYSPGGACNVATNLSNLGAEVLLVGIIGDDKPAGVLAKALNEKGISVEGLVADGKRPTILKTRVFARHQQHQLQQVVRIDREKVDPVSGGCLRKVENVIKKGMRSVDAVIIEDYGKGLITPGLIDLVKKEAKKNKKFLAVDPKENHFDLYKGVNVITPNRFEAEKAVGFKIDSPENVKKAGDKMLSKYRTDVILLTLGEKGMMVFEKGKRPKAIPTLAREVFDVSGAGDTVIAIYTLSVASGASPEAAAHVANCAAGIVVGKIGPEVVDKKELLASIRQETGR